MPTISSLVKLEQPPANYKAGEWGVRGIAGKQIKQESRLRDASAGLS